MKLPIPDKVRSFRVSTLLVIDIVLINVSVLFSLFLRHEFSFTTLKESMFVENYLTAALFREAFAAGYTELWQLAEFFDLPEDCVETALTYWKERKCIDFT